MSKQKVKTIRPFPAGSTLYQIKRGKNKGKWTVWGLEGIQNSLMRFADTPIFVLKTTYPASTSVTGKPIPESTSLQPFLTREELQEWLNIDDEAGIPKSQRPNIEIIEMTLTKDQIVK